MSDRFHREDPKRGHPRRNMSEAFRNDDPWSRRPRFDQASEDDFSRDESANDGLDDAYRIVDDEMREGQWRARWRNQRGADWRTYGSPYWGGYGSRSTEGLLEQIMRVYLDMLGLVGSMVNGLNRPLYPRAPFEARREAEFGRSVYRTRARPAAVRVEIVSNQPVQVVFDLEPMRPRSYLSIPPLRSAPGGKAALHNIQLETLDDRYMLHVRIPDGQPAGRYSGIIIEEQTGEACGRLVVQIGRPASARTGEPSEKDDK